jgi:3-hydroxyisobutyrate dehydrogenase-like beta-hydroxyacid dehydrogenase
MASVAFIGLGAMGAPMAGHLLGAGHTLRVYARRPEATKDLVARGATSWPTPAEAAQGAAFTFVNVTTTGDVEQVLFGPGGVIEGAEAKSIVIDHSTISPSAARSFALRLAERGIDMLDCPVSGGVVGAKAATLSIFVGGSLGTLELARPMLQCVGRTITHVGTNGAGQVAKACNQIVQVITIQAIAEAVLFARTAGVEPERMLAAISTGFAGSRMLDLKGAKMARREFDAGIEARLHQKDYGLIVDMTRDMGIGLPMVALVAQQLNSIVGRGWGRQDTSSLLRVLEETNGKDPRVGRRRKTDHQVH